MTNVTGTQKVLTYLSTVQEATQTQISKHTGLHPYLLKYILESLSDKSKIRIRYKELSTSGNYAYYRLQGRKLQ